MISNGIGLIVVAIIAIAILAVGRGFFTTGRASIEQPYLESGNTLELPAGAVRITIRGSARTTITGGPRTNRYRAVLLQGETERAAREFTITVSQDTKVGTVRNSTLALDTTLDAAGTYRFKLEPAAGNPIDFTHRTITVQSGR